MLRIRVGFIVRVRVRFRIRVWGMAKASARDCAKDRTRIIVSVTVKGGSQVGIDLGLWLL